jgi:DNA-binding transcriptional ArsR family regulator
VRINRLTAECYQSYILFIEYTPMPHALHRFKADFFQALAHPTRIAIIEQLRNGELSAGTLIERVGVEQANASQHLSVLRSKRILTSRKVGNQVLYSLRDPSLTHILDTMKQYFYTQLSEGQAMLEEIRAQAVNS